MTRTLEPGACVAIYEDPLSETVFEANVTLVQRVDKGYDPWMEYWLVRFEDGEELQRYIAKDEVE